MICFGQSEDKRAAGELNKERQSDDDGSRACYRSASSSSFSSVLFLPRGLIYCRAYLCRPSPINAAGMNS